MSSWSSTTMIRYLPRLLSLLSIGASIPDSLGGDALIRRPADGAAAVASHAQNRNYTWLSRLWQGPRQPNQVTDLSGARTDRRHPASVEKTVHPCVLNCWPRRRHTHCLWVTIYRAADRLASIRQPGWRISFQEGSPSSGFGPARVQPERLPRARSQKISRRRPPAPRRRASTCAE
jgi:hypothetical protein